MTNSKITKKALIASVLSLVMCFTMLLGTTFAWFTDSATTGVNTIQSGTLKVDLLDADDNSLVGTTLNFKKAAGAETEPVLWEPGCTYELNPVFVKNNGNLALKYKLEVAGLDGDADLLDVIDWTIKLGATTADLNTFEGHLLAGQKSTEGLTIVGHMQETAGNEYQGLTANGISITVVATQDTVESDSYGNTYDATAEYPIVATTYTPATVADVFTDITAADAGDIIQLPAVADVVDLTGKTIEDLTIKGNDDITVKVTTGGAAPSVNADGVVFENVKFDFGNNSYNAIRGDVTYKNCTFTGMVNSYDNSTFENCTFNNADGQYLAHVYYGAAKFKDCTFNGSNRCVYVYTDGGDAAADFDGCTFNFTTATPNKSAIMLNANNGTGAYTVAIKNCTVNGNANAAGGSNVAGAENYQGVYGLKHKDGNGTAKLVKGTVTVNGATVYNN